MFAVAAPPKAFAVAFKMTGTPKRHSVHEAGITRALEFMDTGRKERRVGSLRKVGLCQRLEAVADFTCGLQRLVLLHQCRTKRAQLCMKFVQNRRISSASTALISRSLASSRSAMKTSSVPSASMYSTVTRSV